jgi:hypothetical protein
MPSRTVASIVFNPGKAAIREKHSANAAIKNEAAGK